MDLGRRYPLVYNAFHAFAEILGEEDRLVALKAMAAHLEPNGVLILTLHNPPVRAARVDAQWRTDGPFEIAERGTSLTVAHHWQMGAVAGRVVGEQRYEERTRQGTVVGQVALPITFDLVTQQEVVRSANIAGLRIDQTCGDYDDSPFDSVRSPYMIFVLSKLPGWEAAG